MLNAFESPRCMTYFTIFDQRGPRKTKVGGCILNKMDKNIYSQVTVQTNGQLFYFQEQ